MPAAPSTTAVSATTSWLSLVPVSTGIRGMYTRDCPGCACIAPRTSCLCEWCNDRAGRTLIVGTADHAGIPNDPVAPCGHAAPNNLAVPKDSDTPNHSDTRMVPVLPQTLGPRTGRLASIPCRRTRVHHESGDGWYACRVPPRRAGRWAAHAWRYVHTDQYSIKCAMLLTLCADALWQALAPTESP